MTFRDLLGLALKSDDVLDLLALHDMTVTYHVDVLREGVPDSYSASNPEFWAELSLDENQIVRTVFCHLTPERKFSANDRSLLGVPFYGTLEEAKAAASASSTPVVVRDGVQSLGRTLSYVRFDHVDCSRHYEYESDALCMITMMVAKRGPRA
jgi:hypothetical protein